MGITWSLSPQKLTNTKAKFRQDAGVTWVGLKEVVYGTSLQYS
jgi:hypothetical protein